MRLSRRRHWLHPVVSSAGRESPRASKCESKRPRLALETLEDRTLLSASLVKDINLNTDSSTPSRLVDVNGTVYFSAVNNAGHTALYGSDGTAAHTVEVRDFGPPPRLNAGLFNLTNVNGRLFFDVYSNGTAELWESDGTATGTQLVKSFPGAYFVNPNGGDAAPTFVSYQNNLYFALRQSSAVQLWKTDGTSTTQVDPGAFSVSDLFPGLTVANGMLYFEATDPAHGSKLWKTDGSDGGTTIADLDIDARNAFGLANLGGTLYFFASPDPTFQTQNLYKTDGNHTTLVQSGFANFDVPSTAVVNDQLFFSAGVAGSFATNLWVTDGVTTRMLNPAHASASGLHPFNLLAVNGRLVFNGFDDSGAIEPIWVSDGNDAGTHVLDPNAAYFAPLFRDNVAVQNGTLYFGAQGANRQELWKTDGTGPATQVADFGPAPFIGGPPSGLTFSNGTLFFSATDAAHGAELWTSNGTAGAQLVKDINTNTLGSNPSQLVNANGELYFTADDGTSLPGIFNLQIDKSNGSAAGTQLVSTPFPSGGPNIGDFPAPLVPAGNFVFFTAGNDPQLWATNTASGTTMLLKDFSEPNSFISAPFNLTAVGNVLFFTVDNGGGTEQLWKSNGTPEGTVLVADHVYVEASTGLGISGLYYFVSYDPNTSNSQLWESDGSALGTHVVDASHPGTNVNGLTDVNGKLFYFDSDATNGFSLWTSGGTTNTELADFPSVTDYLGGYDATNVNGTLYFAVGDNSTGTAELWKSDGTPTGTVRVALVRPDYGSVVAVGNRLFFTVNDPTLGEQLWVSDGTDTHLVAPIVAGVDQYRQALPFDLTSFGGKVFFAASDPIHGGELWESDGTGAGTFMVQDVNPGSSGSMPENLTVVKGTLFFTANDGSHGAELWAYNPTTHFQAAATSKLATPGSAFSVTVTALDQYDHVDTSYTGTVSLVSSDPAAPMLATYSYTPADNGVHTFAVTLRTPGAQTITVKDAVFATLVGTTTLTVPQDVSGLVLHFNTPLIHWPGTTSYFSELFLFNSSRFDIAGPIEIVFRDLPSGVRLVNATGVTASGDPYIRLDVSAFKAGSLLGVLLKFSDPQKVRISSHIGIFGFDFTHRRDKDANDLADRP